MLYSADFKLGMLSCPCAYMTPYVHVGLASPAAEDMRLRLLQGTLYVRPEEQGRIVAHDPCACARMHTRTSLQHGDPRFTNKQNNEKSRAWHVSAHVTAHNLQNVFKLNQQTSRIMCVMSNTCIAKGLFPARLPHHWTPFNVANLLFRPNARPIPNPNHALV